MPATIRPAVPGDAAAICALLNEVDVLEIGRPETDLHEVEADLKRPDDLAGDSWLAFDGSRLVGYGLLWDDSHGERIDIDHYTLPGHQRAAADVLALMEARAREKAAANGAGRAVVQLSLNIEPTLDTALLTGRGWDVVRRYHVMTRAVSSGGDPVPVPPPGVRLRDCTAEADRRQVHALLQRAMAGHFGFRPQSYESWIAEPETEHFDWSVIWIAAVDGIGDAGALLARDDRESMGWVSLLGVLDGARGRGLGGYLLRHAFAAFAARGRERVGLGVDTRNATGALGLYERHGMARYFAVNTWEVTRVIR